MSLPGEPHTPETNVEYIITAEFDNKYGPTITCQYPEYIPGFEILKDAEPSKEVVQLASLMIPSNIEHKTSADADSNIFMLHLNKKSSRYQLLPPNQDESEHQMKLKCAKTHDTLYFVTIVKAETDVDNSRGAKIRSIALGTTLENLEMMKPVLVEALEYIMSAQDTADINEILKNCFGALNSLDLSVIRRMIENTSLQHLLHSISDDVLLSGSLDDQSESGEKVRKLLGLDSKDKYGNTFSMKQGTISVQFNKYQPAHVYRNLTKKPLVINIMHCNSLSTTLYDEKVLKFLRKLIPVVDALPSDKYSFKIIINSDTSSKKIICQFIIELASLMGCFSVEQKYSYYKGAPIIVLPYAEVSMMNDIKSYLMMRDRQTLFALIGTANPIFKHHNDLWDLYYDLDTDSLYKSKEEAINDKGGLWDPMSIKRFLHKNIEISSFQSQDSLRLGLMAKFLDIISEEKPQQGKVAGVLKRINILQMMYADTIKETFEQDDQNYLRAYVLIYKDFVKFDELFKATSLKSIRYLTSLSGSIATLFKPEQSPSEREESLSKLHTTLEGIYRFVHSNNSNLEEFMSICFSYPFCQSSLEGNLMRRNFLHVNLRKEWTENLKKDNAWLYIVDKEHLDGVINTFVRDRSLNLLSLPLLLNPDIRRRKSQKSENLERHSMIGTTSTSSLNGELESKRPRSMSLKWMLNLASPKNRDSFIDSSSIRSGSDISSLSAFSASKMTATLSDSNASLSSSSSSSSSLISSKRVSFRRLRFMTDKVRGLACLILSEIESHPIGEILIKEWMSPFLQVTYQSSKSEREEYLKNL